MSVNADVTTLTRVDPATMTRADVRAALVVLARVRGWLDALQGRLSRRLDALADEDASIFPEADVADATNTDQRDAAKKLEQAKVLGYMPIMESALAAGRVSLAHIEALNRAIKRLKLELRSKLITQDRRLTEIASTVTPDAFERVLKREVHRIDGAEAKDRLDHQRRKNVLRTWVDRMTGMICGHFELDPETGLRVLGRLDAVTDTLFHGPPPEYCPDGEAKQGFLRALALTNLILATGASTAASTAGNNAPSTASTDSDSGGDGAGSGGDGATADGTQVEPDRERIDRVGTRSDMIIVIDWLTLLRDQHPGSRIDNGFGVELPVESYRRWACTHNLIPAVLDADGALMELGRSRRVASASQRRSLMAMYRTCAIPGCTVSSRHCQPHHIRYWTRDFGPTDLANLVPVCSKHHHAVHEGGWIISLDERRCLTIRYPDGAIQTTGPPGDQWAA